MERWSDESWRSSSPHGGPHREPRNVFSPSARGRDVRSTALDPEALCDGPGRFRVLADQALTESVRGLAFQEPNAGA
eukprot:8259945-Alexandrium_andersonii.AAC.1